jgi:hypothetical protein
MSTKPTKEGTVPKRTDGQKQGPSKPYLRLREGRINSKEYTDQIKKSVKRSHGKQAAEHG